MFRALLAFLVLVCPIGLGSCGSAGRGANPTAASTKKTGWFAVPDIFPARVPVVKVRTKDLKELPLGHERALAFAKQRQSGLWAVGATAEFVQPKLPEAGSEMDGSLLPPKDP